MRFLSHSKVNIVLLPFIIFMAIVALLISPRVPAHGSSSQLQSKIPLSVYFGSDYSYAYALNARDGSVRWRYQYQPGNAWSTPTVVNNVVYIGASVDGSGVLKAIVALNASDGSVKW